MNNPFQILQITQQADESLVRLLTDNVIGTPGQSMLYKHVQVAGKVKSIRQPVFCNLSIRNRLYGTITFCGRTVSNLGRKFPAYYVRYFTFAEALRSGHGQSRSGKQGRIREEVRRLMNGEGLKDGSESILYAYVDPENVRSKRLIEEFGFERVGVFHTIPFSRISPKDNPDVVELAGEGFDLFREKLNQHYAGYQLVSFDDLEGKGNCYALIDEGEMICAAQAITDAWQILALPGIAGKLMMKVVPKLPWIKRLFHPDYRFVFLEGVFCKTGYENRLAELFESILYRCGVYSAILCLDPRAKLYSQLSSVNLGLTHQLMGEKEIEIFVKTAGKWHSDPVAPFFISGYDVL